ncbi:ribonuclease H-like domain-containing protein [Tanacetum coccineum]
MNVEALQTKYSIIDWEIYTEGAIKYWKIIRVGNHTEVYQFFNDMLKAFDKEDLVKLWSLVKEKFNSTEPIEDKEKEIWVELKRLFEPDTDNEKGKRHLHADREGVSIVKRNSYTDASCKALAKESILSWDQQVVSELQKIVSQLAILGENISQEDLNLKFLRSLPFEWKSHVVVWRNKPDLDTISFDDHYNNFKIVEQEVKGTASSSLSSSSQNMAFVSSLSSANEVNTAYGVSRKITINGSDTTGYDKSKVKCFNCHKMGHFSRNCRGLKNQDSRNRNQDSSKRTVNVEETSSKAMAAIDGAGFDWSYMADDEVPTNMALIAVLDSEVHNDKTCSKTCLKSFETLKTQLDDLRIEFNKSEFSLATYKRGLASIKEQLVFYKKNEVIFCEQLAILKRDISYKDSEISMLKRIQITDKSRKGVGFVSYNAIPPPPTELFSPPKFDLSYSSLEEFQQLEFESYGPKTSKSVSEDISNEVRESPNSPLVKELVSDEKLEKKTIFPTVAKI